jgi:ATP-dependent helicase YprA (DUF1998 family)
MLKKQLQKILSNNNLDVQRTLATDIAAELGVDILDLAAALLYSNHENRHSLVETQEKPNHHPWKESYHQKIKMVRYRLGIGSQHQLTVEALKKVLVDESGVDINNINNINIHGLYTVLELPDNMPQDIFAHLKSVAINEQKLDIKRLKSNNNKKRGKNRSRRGRQTNTKTIYATSETVDCG